MSKTSKTVILQRGVGNFPLVALVSRSLKGVVEKTSINHVGQFWYFCIWVSLLWSLLLIKIKKLTAMEWMGQKLIRVASFMYHAGHLEFQTINCILNHVSVSPFDIMIAADGAASNGTAEHQKFSGTSLKNSHTLKKRFPLCGVSLSPLTYLNLIKFSN